MILVPVIWLKDGNCRDVTDREKEGHLDVFDDPIRLARLWRIQNAKMIQIELRKQVCEEDLDTIKKICDSLDIPVVVGVPTCLEKMTTQLLEMGVMRVVINRKIETEKSSKKICGLVDLRRVALRYKLSIADLRKHKEQILGDMMFTKSSRLIVRTGFGKNPESRSEIVSGISELMSYLREGGCRARLSLQVPIDSYQDLAELTELKGSGVDSLILPKTIYDNVFPCQALWCWNSPDKVDLSKFSTADLRAAN